MLDSLSPEIRDQLHVLMRIFLAENAKINLSALRTEEACWPGNILDSLPLLEILPSLGTVERVLDVGTGGGFPLLPLAIARDDIHWTGLDSTGKKIQAVRRIALSLDLRNVELVTERAEDAGHERAHRENYDLVLARAVAGIPTLLEFTAPFARIGGHVVLWKSLHADEEIAASAQAQKTLGCALTSRHRYTLPDPHGERQLLVFTKQTATPKQYPRPNGIPKKTPL